MRGSRSMSGGRPVPSSSTRPFSPVIPRLREESNAHCHQPTLKPTPTLQWWSVWGVVHVVTDRLRPEVLQEEKPGISRGPGFYAQASLDTKTIADRLWLFCSGDLNRRGNPVRGASLLGPRDGLPVPHRRRPQHHAAHTCVSGGAATINFETAKQEMNPFHPTLHSRV